MMKAVILDGAGENDTGIDCVRRVLITGLRSRGWDTMHIMLAGRKIGPCAGDFFCWIRTPGVCNIDDDNRRIAAELATADMVVYLTPVTFGGYSSMLKRMVDHQIQNISPLFTTIGGETHHHKRYARNPDMLAFGWMAAPDDRSEAVFRHLFSRNAINFHAGRKACDVAHAGQPEAEIRAVVNGCLDDILRGQASPPPPLPLSEEKPLAASAVRRALLLVGSPKTRKSSSGFLGGYLFEQLAGEGIATETVYLHTSVPSPEKMASLQGAIEAADLVMLAFPLYVDALPAPVTEALEKIAAHRQNREPARRPLFTALVNCGFPEAVHNDTALAICEIFAGQAGFEWAGSLSLGGGGIVNGKPLAESGGKTARIRKALDMAAAALALGQAVPGPARELLAKPSIPARLYRFAGDRGWKQQAQKYGMRDSLDMQPYLETE